MRLKRPRLSLKASLGLVAGCAVILAGVRVYREGPRLHYALLKYRFGGAERRRTALDEIRMIGIEKFEDRGTLGPLVLPLLVETLGDRDPIMRMKASEALSVFG